MTAPASLAEALTASKLARTTQLAWQSAYHGKVMPKALSDALTLLIHAGDQATAAGVLEQVRQRALGDAERGRSGACENRR